MPGRLTPGGAPMPGHLWARPRRAVFSLFFVIGVAILPRLKLPLIKLPIDRIVLDEVLPVLRHRLGIVTALAPGVAGHAGKQFPAGGDTSFSSAYSLWLRTIRDVDAVVHEHLIAERDSLIVLAPKLRVRLGPVE